MVIDVSRVNLLDSPSVLSAKPMRSFSLVSATLSLAVVALAGCSSSSGSNVPPQEVPASVTQWAPEGARTVGDYEYGVIPQPNGFHTMHVGPNNTDNVWVALAPELEIDWVAYEPAEAAAYVTMLEIPGTDAAGNRPPCPRIVSRLP